MKNKSLIIFGTGQQSDIISFYLKKLSRKIVAYCVDDKHYKKNKFNGIGVVTTSELLKRFKPKDYSLHIAITYSDLNTLRSDKFKFFNKKGYSFENVINNPKLINTDTKIGKNVVILDSYIQPKAMIGDNTFIWSSSVIGHHTKLGNHCWISSGVTIGGNCEIKDYSFFGMNATIGHFVKVDKSCFIGSSTHITKNVKKESVIINPDSKIIPFNAKKFLKIKKFK